MKEQCRNRRRRSGKPVVAFGIRYSSVAEAAEVHGKNRATVRNRIRDIGLTLEDALTLPVGRWANR